MIEEVKYPDWISNVVLVKKKNEKWRVCIDFTNLNKACPKDNFLVPKIDQMIDATASYDRLYFFDAYSGYNQILLTEEDQEKTAFITERGIYCFKVMPFGLKNTSAMYQRLLNKMFKDLIGNIMKSTLMICASRARRRNHTLNILPRSLQSYARSG